MLDKYIKQAMPEFYNGDYKKLSGEHMDALQHAFDQEKLIPFVQGGSRLVDAFEWCMTPQGHNYWSVAQRNIDFEEGKPNE